MQENERGKQARIVVLVLCSLMLSCESAAAWSNRGHRLVNLAAAETLPADMPAFMRTPAAIAEISYLGPEPDRWRPNTAPDLSQAWGPDHFFRYEAGMAASPLPRRRFEYMERLEHLRTQHPEDKAQLTVQFIGALPWGVEEVYERLVTAFYDYRLVTGEFPAGTASDLDPMSKDDLPHIEAAAEYYAGWMGHYVGDGCMPLHSSINIHTWSEKTNPNGYSTKMTIHHVFELTADEAIAQHKVSSGQVESYMPAPRLIGDSFRETLQYLRTEGTFVEPVYRWEKQGALAGSGTPEVDEFIARRMADGSAMLRDLIYTAWVQSKLQEAPAAAATVTLTPR
jgi:hypothetical protein